MSDEYTTHEALDRTSMLADLVEKYLIENGAIAENPEWHALAQRACESLCELYQAIGAKHL